MSEHSLEGQTFLQRLMGRFYFVGSFWYWFHHWGVRHGTHKVPGLHTGWAVFFWLVLRRTVSAVASNLAGVLGPCSWWEGQKRGFRTFLSWTNCRTERFEQYTENRPELHIETEGAEHWEEATRDGKGLLILSAHVGAFEALRFLPDGLVGRTVHSVRAPELDPRADRFMKNLIQQGSRPDEITHIHGEPGLALKLRDALRRDEIVAIPGDRSPRADAPSTMVEFCGKPFSLPTGPASLARSAGVRALPLFFVQDGRLAYRIIVGKPIDPPRNGTREELARATQEYARSLEHVIKRYPYQWFCFNRVWHEGPVNP